MIITIDLQKYHDDKSIGFMQFLALHIIAKDNFDREILRDHIDDVDVEILEYNDYIKIIGPNFGDIVLRDKGLALVGEQPADPIIDLATNYRNLFPKGIKSGGYPVRSDIPSIADKLRRFKKVYKYTDEQILQATKNYIQRKAGEGYAYMSTAVYFIDKNKNSLLAAECDNLTDEEITVKSNVTRI